MLKVKDLYFVRQSVSKILLLVFFQRCHHEHCSSQLKVAEIETKRYTILPWVIESIVEIIQSQKGIKWFLFYNVCIYVRTTNEQYECRNLDEEQKHYSKQEFCPHYLLSLSPRSWYISCESKSIPIRMIPLSLEVTMSRVTEGEEGEGG